MSIFLHWRRLRVIFGIDYDTLNQRIKEAGYSGFPEFFNMHSATGRISLRRTQFKLSETNVAMAIWLGKQYLGQTETQELRVGGINQDKNDEVARKNISEMIEAVEKEKGAIEQ
jgi:hypothetical protein